MMINRAVVIVIVETNFQIAWETFDGLNIHRTSHPILNRREIDREGEK